MSRIGRFTVETLTGMHRDEEEDTETVIPEKSEYSTSPEMTRSSLMDIDFAHSERVQKGLEATASDYGGSSGIHQNDRRQQFINGKDDIHGVYTSTDSGVEMQHQKNCMRNVPKRYLEHLNKNFVPFFSPETFYTIKYQDDLPPQDFLAEWDFESYKAAYKRQRGKEGLVKRVINKMPLPFISKSHKTPADVVKVLREALLLIEKDYNPQASQQEKKVEKAIEEVSKNIILVKAFIYATDGGEPNTEQVMQVAQLAQEVYNANVLPMLIRNLSRFEFECKKDVAQIFNNLLRRQIGTRSPTVEYLGARPEILVQLVMGYTMPDIALTCGSMLRESIRHDLLAKMILTSDVFYHFFFYVQSEVFDIASDAFSTFKDLVTRHKSICAEFLDANYDVFFDSYEKLLNSTNYVTRRQSLKLLGELLLDRHNFNIMTKYISNPENLRLLMELLRDKSRNIQYEAFHVFKVFVANPNKPKPISDILNRNREKLVLFLGEFHNERTDDEQFNDEKAYLIKQIQEMKSSPKERKPKKDEHENEEPIDQVSQKLNDVTLKN